MGRVATGADMATHLVVGSGVTVGLHYFSYNPSISITFVPLNGHGLPGDQVRQMFSRRFAKRLASFGRIDFNQPYRRLVFSLCRTAIVSPSDTLTTSR